jgi:hypothetical protein
MMDKLTQMFLGKYKDNKLEVKTTLNAFDHDHIDGLSKRLLEKQMREHIASALNHSKFLEIFEMPPDYNELGKPFYGRCYAFTQAHLVTLIEDAFECGKLAAGNNC